ncbi:MAG: ABC-F family ATP-binding cassette domain-containing protein [Bacteroides sp.]|nr:ABC-F family ATP-binding cassette domain-containing protein [Bacteroides sp.]MCM1379749.1 ABC-F family ATP-binding cassette domain-containing protein [Bacteroides sp.]MCM1445710.1 ABC-F family ATP-binding cassette domain-containing protein [Prevotella sp.]
MAPTSYIQIDRLTKSYGDRLLFCDVTFGINRGDKIGLIAKNGTGKTTMLRIIAGIEAPDSGTVTLRSGIKVALIEQKPHGDPNSTLSRGQQKRAEIAEVLLSEPDVIILDEPTNHLDIASIEWLEGMLTRSQATVLLVTHDRYFLDRICNKIIEIDLGRIFTYQGNYAEYLRRREERINALTGELAKVRNVLRKEQDWMNRQPQARAGKAKFRIDAFHELKRRSTQKVTDSTATLNLDFKSSRIGSKIFEAEGVTKHFGDLCVLDDFTYTFARYDKVGIVGPNGVGKSTFIKMLQGIIPPDSGSFTIGETVRFGYYCQDGLKLPQGKKVIDAVSDIAEDIVLAGGERHNPMQFLQRFLFTPKDQQKYISTLSGGELARLHLATVLMQSPNFLILDEPTNDLDIITLGLLEEYLTDFKGCLIVVSHDRYFLDNIVDHIFVFTGNGVVKDFPGNYTDYRKFCAENTVAESKPTPEKKPKPVQTEKPRKLSFKEKRRLEELETMMDKLNAEKAQLEDFFANGDGSDIEAKSARYSELKSELEDAELEWLELSEV